MTTLETGYESRPLNSFFSAAPRAASSRVPGEPALPLKWQAAWWTVSRGLLRNFSTHDPATVTIGQTLRTAMQLLGMRDPKINRCHRLELAYYLEIPAETVAALLDDMASVTPELALKLHDRTGVPISYWHLLRKYVKNGNSV